MSVVGFWHVIAACLTISPTQTRLGHCGRTGLGDVDATVVTVVTLGPQLGAQARRAGGARSHGLHGTPLARGAALKGRAADAVPLALGGAVSADGLGALARSGEGGPGRTRRIRHLSGGRLGQGRECGCGVRGTGHKDATGTAKDVSRCSTGL